MEHEHDPILRSDGTIQCQICEEILPDMEKEIAKVSSAKRVRSIMHEIAVAGRYRVADTGKDFVVYARDLSNYREELTAEKICDRNYRIFKKIITA